MFDHTDLKLDRRPAPVAAAATVVCEGMIWCPMVGPAASFLPSEFYRAAYEQAARTIHRMYPGRIVSPSLN